MSYQFPRYHTNVHMDLKMCSSLTVTRGEGINLPI